MQGDGEGRAPKLPPFITRWDLDKTYLRSRFDTWSELLEAAFERAEDKRAVPGATAVLRELGGTGARVHVLSGSPRQLRRKLEAKLSLDGVRWDELTLKPNLSNLVRLRLRALRDQLSYKLPELLSARARDQESFGTSARVLELLVGDDSESDAFVYSLYADLCAGVVEWRELERIFEAGRAYSQAVARCRSALAVIERAPIVSRIFIHLDGQTPPSHFAHFGSRLIPFYNYLQPCFVLLETGVLSAEAVLRVAQEFHLQHGFSADMVARSYFDLTARGHARGGAAALLRRALQQGDPQGQASPPPALEEAVQRLEAHVASPPRVLAAARRLDYVELASHYVGGRNRRRPGQRFG